MKPIEGKYYETQGYGLTQFASSATGRKAYANFPGGIHPGLDFGTGGINLQALSTIPGKVVFAGANGGWGNYVEVLGSDGWRRQYAHLESIGVKVGDSVMPGTVIGRVGTTGASTGTHLHYGNRRRTMLGAWEYRDPSGDLATVPAASPMPTGKLVKSKARAEVYAFNGTKLFYIPSIATLKFLFGVTKIEIVEEDVLSKIPKGDSFPDLN